MSRVVSVLIATPLERELVDRLVRVDDRSVVRYEPDLLPPPRYRSDHRGDPAFRRGADAERRWRNLLGSAEVLLGIPGEDPALLADVVRSNRALRWVQATAAGAGEQVAAARLSEQERERVAVTTASGMHAGPLAEFALFGLLAFSRGLPRLRDDQQARRWDHYPVHELRDRTLVVLGLGAIGREVARLASAFGMRVIGVNRSGRNPGSSAERVIATGEFVDVLPDADAGVVVTVPSTDATRGLLDAAALAALPRTAVVVNVGRGAVIDEPALIEALVAGRLAGAALDVFAQEPLPDDSPLWQLPNAILSPHTAALSPRENERLVDLFAANLRRYLDGRELMNRVRVERGY